MVGRHRPRILAGAARSAQGAGDIGGERHRAWTGDAAGANRTSPKAASKPIRRCGAERRQWVAAAMLNGLPRRSGCRMSATCRGRARPKRPSAAPQLAVDIIPWPRSSGGPMPAANCRRSDRAVEREGDAGRAAFRNAARRGRSPGMLGRSRSSAAAKAGTGLESALLLTKAAAPEAQRRRQPPAHSASKLNPPCRIGGEGSPRVDQDRPDVGPA